MTRPIFKSENINDLGLLQNEREHGPEGCKNQKNIEDLNPLVL